MGRTRKTCVAAYSFDSHSKVFVQDGVDVRIDNAVFVVSSSVPRRPSNIWEIAFIHDMRDEPRNFGTEKRDRPPRSFKKTSSFYFLIANPKDMTEALQRACFGMIPAAELMRPVIDPDAIKESP